MNDVPLWRPSEARVAASNIQAFIERVNAESNAGLADFKDLYAWSVADKPAFWRALIDFAGIEAESWGEQFRSSLIGAIHHRCVERCRVRGKELQALPFPVGVYKIHTGENLSFEPWRRLRQHGWKRELFRALTPTFRPTRELAREFSMEVEPRPWLAPRPAPAWASA